MKKLTLFFALLLGMFLFPSVETHAAAVPRVMAYDLKSEKDTPKGFTKFTFSTNTKPTKAYLIFYHAGSEVYRTDITTQAQKQLKDATYTLRTSDLPELTNMKWAIEVQGEAISTFAEVGNDGLRFDRGFATMDNNPESNYFGRVYVADRRSTKANGGLFVYNPDLSRVNEDVNKLGLSASGFSRPAVGSDGTIYLASYSDLESGIFVVNPADLTVCTQFYNGTRASNGLFTNANGEELGSSTSGVGIYGEGKNTVVYSKMEDGTGISSGKFPIVCYQIGQTDGSVLKSWNKAPTWRKSDFLNYGNNGFAATDKGVWVSQNKATSDSRPGFVFIDKNGELKYNAQTNGFCTDGTFGAGIATNAANDRLYVNGQGGYIHEFKVDWNGTTPTLTEITSHKTGYTYISTLSVDLAGNLIACAGNYFRSNNTNEMRLVRFVIPTTTNSCITPAKSTMQVDGPPTCRVLPHDLTVVDNGDSYTISYKTNTNAQSGNLVLFKEDGKTIDKTFALTTPIQRKKVNQITVAKSELPARNKIAWGIELTGKAVPKYTYLQEITDHTRQIYDFYNTQGVVVDNNPESDYFGKIYVQATLNGASDGSSDRADAQKAGLFIYNQWLDELNPTSNVGIQPSLPSGYSIGSNYQFNRLAIDPTTNNITYCYAVSGKPAVFSMNRANLTGTPTNLLAGQTGITRSVAHCFDADGNLYVMDLPGSGQIFKIDKNGTKTTFGSSTSKYVQVYTSLASDGRGGLWISQNRSAIDTYYQLVHYNASGTVDFAVYQGSENGFTGGSARGALAYDAERQILAQGRDGTVVLFDVTYNATTGVPTLTKRDAVASIGGNKIDGLAFDYVGDLYVVNSGKEKFQKFTIPTDNNTCLVPAKKSLALDNAQITYELNGGVTNDYGWMSKDDMFKACMNDGGVTTLPSLTELKALGNDAALTAICGKFGKRAAQEVLDNDKWNWLEEYVMSVQNASSATKLVAGGDPTDNTGWAYAIAAFFIEGQRTIWPVSADFTQAGLDEAYQRAWKHGYDNPTKPTSEFVLNTPYKDGYTFDGWYAAADCSGAKVTKVQPNMNGTLYAKWIEYIPTIAEVKALADNATTNVAGVVTHVSGNEVFVQDATGGIVIVTTSSATCNVGQKVTANGTKTITNGAPQVVSATITTTEAGTLPEETAFEGLTKLVNDTELKYYATRVIVPGLKVASYDSNGYPTLTDGINSALCYKMPINQSTFPVGTKVIISAVGGWNNGFQFRGDVAGVTLAPGIAKDNYAYPARENGKYTLVNKWIVSNVKGNYQSNKPGPDNYVRAMAATNGKMYFINRETESLTIVDGATGEMLNSVAITGTDLFKVDGNNAVTVKFNDIKTDDAGNILISACVSGGNTFFVYKVNPTTGVATELIKDRLQDTWTGLSYRFDAIGVAGDVTNNGVVMAANANAWEAYRWKISGGVVGSCEKITLTHTGSNPGTAPQIQPIDAQGKQFYVDGQGITPTLFSEDGSQVGKFAVGAAVRNNGSDVVYLNQSLNGITEFTVGNEQFAILIASATNTAHPSTYALYKFTDDTHNISTAEPLWFFPNDGMGTVTNGSFAAPVSVEVDDNVATIYLYSANNGYAAYTFTVEEKEIIIDDKADNTTALAEYEGQTVTAKVTRAFNNDSYKTLTLPFDMTEAQIKAVFGETAIVHEFTSVGEENDMFYLHFDPTTTIEAGKPYIIQLPTTGDYDAKDGFTIENVTINTTLNPVVQGAITMQPVLDGGGRLSGSGEYWLASDNYLYSAENHPTPLLGLRAYFINNTGRPIRARVVYGEDEATSIPTVVAPEESVRKVMKDGQIIIIRGEKKYNIQGQVIE